MNRVYDVAVVGAGPIGLAFLGALSQANFHAAGTKPFLLIDQVKTLP
jgi:cation diffusion facilitator CzcD-associated flavoprotein CzcO